MGLLISSREGGTRESPWNQCGPLTLCLGKGVRVEIDELQLPVPGWGPGGRDSHPRSPSQRPCRPHVAPGRLRRALGEVGAEMGGALRGAPWRMLGAWGALHRVGPGGMSGGRAVISTGSFLLSPPTSLSALKTAWKCHLVDGCSFW